jgi:hypothetical protein
VARDLSGDAWLAGYQGEGMTRQVRPVKWIVQPVFVSDDGEHLDELPVGPLAISARDWPEWVGGGWRKSLELLQAKLAEAGEPVRHD